MIKYITTQYDVASAPEFRAKFDEDVGGLRLSLVKDDGETIILGGFCFEHLRSIRAACDEAIQEKEAFEEHVCAEYARLNGK